MRKFFSNIVLPLILPRLFPQVFRVFHIVFNTCGKLVKKAALLHRFDVDPAVENPDAI